MTRKRTSPNRNVQIADQIQRDLSELIMREFKDPRIGLVTIQSVELTPDYAHAKVYFTTLTGNPADTQEALNRAAGHLHNLLFKRLTSIRCRRCISITTRRSRRRSPCRA